MTNDQIAFRQAITGDFAAVMRLLDDAGLPPAGLESQFPDQYIVAEAGGSLIAVAGLEIYGRYGLLRSVAVDAGFRGAGIGRRLVVAALAKAREQELSWVYLLTLTARDYFARLGFADIDRRQAPDEIRQSAEFESICPVTSAFMGRQV